MTCYNSELPIGPPGPTGPQGPPGTSPTITSTDGSIEIDNTDPNAPDLSIGYRSYVFLLRSTVGSDLTTQVLTNTVTETITVTYGSGVFTITKPTNFNIDKTTFEIGVCPNAFFGYIVGGIGASNTFDFNFIDLDSNSVTDLGSAGVLIKLNIYP
jgi:hypothetical protein